jgi:hypothetical protein
MNYAGKELKFLLVPWSIFYSIHWAVPLALGILPISNPKVRFANYLCSFTILLVAKL